LLEAKEMAIIKKLTKEWIIPILGGLLLAFLINRYLLFKIEVPSESMYPTIKIGDNIFVTRIYNYGNIKRGQIIEFYSEELKIPLIKRVIGLPGETVEVKEDGTVLVNNIPILEPYVKNKGGKSGVYKVPEGKYFFLGDNRANSLDSRYWKNSFISKIDIKGKAIVTVYPFNRIGFLK
jgi:signal peptidase I